MHWSPIREAGLARLAEFLPHAGRAYASSRNHDEGASAGDPRRNVSQLSPWLHAGQLSEREVIAGVLERHSEEAADKFIVEVFWRIYFKGYLEQRSTIWNSYCEGRDAALAQLERDDGMAAMYVRAVEGRTGIAAFDHWARELVQTGYLHNHARMWFASIWIFTLRLDWHLGADLFLRHLIDADAASNTLSWRWVGGLHTRGKTYLARADNIARYTADHPQGPLAAEGLATEAPALTEACEHQRQTLDLPSKPAAPVFEQPYALLLHDEAASHEPIDLPHAPALVIGAARPDTRSPGETGGLARTFAQDAVENGLAEAAVAFGCPSIEWRDGESLSDLLTKAGIRNLAHPYLPTGWTRDALWPEIAPLHDQGRAFSLLAPLSRATWPRARAGFFQVKKHIPAILSDLGIGRQPSLFEPR